VGAVYVAEHVEIKKQVAIKVLHTLFAQSESFRLRFEREAQAASKVSHPGCVSVLDFGRVTTVEPADGGTALIGTPYLVMELVQGEVLRDRMDAGRMPAPEAVRVTRGVLLALRHAHGLGLVHRDVKPGNIMLATSDDAAPTVKLLDFGLAKDVASESPALTEPGTVFGTPGYLSPEQAMGGAADARSDLYAVGVMLFEMLVGERLFATKEPMALVRHHIATAPRRPGSLVPSLSKALDEVVQKALRKKPQERFQNADAFLTALSQCAEDATKPLAVPPPSAPSLWVAKAGAFWRARPRIVLAAGAGLLVLVGVIVLATRQKPAPLVFEPTVVSAAAPVSSPSTRRRLVIADDYGRKLWCSDAIDELERALREDPGLRTDAEVTRIAIPCLRARTQAKALRFLVEMVGRDAIPALQTAATGDPKPDVRDGAARALSLLR